MDETEEEQRARHQAREKAVYALIDGASRWYASARDRTGGTEGFKALTDAAEAYCRWLGWTPPEEEDFTDDRPGGEE